MRIIKLQSSGLKKLLATDIIPKGTPPPDNGSSAAPPGTALDAIRQALDASMSDQAEPTPATQQYTLTVSSAKQALLSVQPRNSTTYESPEALHDVIRRSRTLEAFAFARLSGAEQRTVLLAIGTLPLDLEAVEAKRNTLLAERAEATRTLKQCDITLATLTAPAADLPQGEMSPTSLVNELLAAQAQQIANAGLRKQLSDLREKAATMQKDLARLDKQIRELQEQRGKLQQDYDLVVAMGKEQATRVDALTDPNVPALQESLATLETRNAAIHAGQRYRSLQHQAEAARRTIEQTTAALATIDATKAEALRATALPFTIPGLAITDTAVTLNGKPTAEAPLPDQLRVSLTVALHQHPTLRVIRLPHHLLTRQTLTVIEELAPDPAYQIWTEALEDNSPVSLQIEAAAPPPAPASPSPVSSLAATKATSASAAQAKTAATATPPSAPTKAAESPAPTPPPTAPPATPSPAPAQGTPPAVAPATGTPQPTLPGTPPPTGRPGPPRPPARTPHYATRSKPPATRP